MAEPQQNRSLLKSLPLVALILASLFALFFLDVGHYISWQALSENHNRLTAYVTENALLAGLIFILVYALATALSLPGGVILTLMGGFLFGSLLGTAYVTLGATLGAVGIFLAARSALADLLRARVGKAMERMEKGFSRNAVSYLLFLRLVPVFPFWLVNIVPAFLGVSLRVYALTTFFGILPGTLVYASLGSGLGHLLESGQQPDLSIIFSPEVLLPLLGLALLSLVPIAYKKLKARKGEAAEE